MRNTQRLHFVGIGGIGMSGIAEILLNLGYAVSGSDLVLSNVTRRLQQQGATVYQGHAAAHVQGADVVVVSAAVQPDNIEVLTARAQHIPVIPRAEMLAELMRMKYGVAIAGTHGKTTTTSLVATILAYGGLDPTVLIGGRLNSLGSNAKLGQGEYLVAEADESDGSFLLLSPTISVVTTVDAEHLDFYGDLAAVQRAFVQFINKVPFYGCSIICLDQPHIRSLVPQIRRRCITYGLTTQADYMARDLRLAGLRSHFEVFRTGERLGQFSLNLPGTHNVANALAAIAVGVELDIPLPAMAQALEEFSGVHRRFDGAEYATALRSWTIMVTIPRRFVRRCEPLKRSGPRLVWWWSFNRIATPARTCCSRNFVRPSTMLMRWCCSISMRPAKRHCPG